MTGKPSIQLNLATLNINYVLFKYYLLPIPTTKSKLFNIVDALLLRYITCLILNLHINGDRKRCFAGKERDMCSH